MMLLMYVTVNNMNREVIRVNDNTTINDIIRMFNINTLTIISMKCIIFNSNEDKYEALRITIPHDSYNDNLRKLDAVEYSTIIIKEC